MKTDDELRTLAALAAATRRVRGAPGGTLAPGVRSRVLEDWARATPPHVVLELAERVLRAEAIVRNRTECDDHAGNCCVVWCRKCQAGSKWEREASEIDDQQTSPTADNSAT